MTVSPFYSASGATSPVDGSCKADTALSWAAAQGHVGTGSQDDQDWMNISYLVQDRGPPPLWRYMQRGILLFNTANIPDTDIVTAATLGFVIIAGQFGNDFDDSICLVASDPANPDELVNGDYDSLGTDRYAADLALSGLTHDDNETVHLFTFNATGLAAIIVDGITELGIRGLADFNNSEPSMVGQSDDDRTYVLIAPAEHGLDGDRRPALTVTHAPAFTPSVIMI